MNRAEIDAFTEMRPSHRQLLKGTACLIAVYSALGLVSIIAADLRTMQGTQWSPFLQ